MFEAQSFEESEEYTFILTVKNHNRSSSAQKTFTTFNVQIPKIKVPQTEWKFNTNLKNIIFAETDGTQNDQS